MSSGPKAWEEELETKRFAEHCKRLEELGINSIAANLEDIQFEIRRFETYIPAMSRQGWDCLDYLKSLLHRLS